MGSNGNGNGTTRSFNDAPATRESVPLLIGLVSPSGGGKTTSALRLATGIQRVTGGDIGFIDTESRRALHYADKFKFRHLDFGAPFSPLDYLAAIEHYAKKGVGVVIVDSMSHEHEGPGGVLEMHEAEVKRMAGDDYRKAERVKMLAWAKPKQQRRRMINTILQLPVTSIFCFRAKEKLKIVPGKEPEPRGWMPIAGEEFIYEMTVNCLLPPASNGTPDWNPQEQGSKQIIKLPEQFRDLFRTRQSLSEDIGEAMAQWAAGGASPKGNATAAFNELSAKVATCDDTEALTALWPSITDAKKHGRISPDEYATLREAVKNRRDALVEPTGEDAEPAEDPDAMPGEGDEARA